MRPSPPAPCSLFLCLDVLLILLKGSWASTFAQRLRCPLLLGGTLALVLWRLCDRDVRGDKVAALAFGPANSDKMT